MMSAVVLVLDVALPWQGYAQRKTMKGDDDVTDVCEI